jgi:phagosome assembly factor 1
LSPENQHDYFLNYFDLGVDFLINGTTHCVDKIVLHTNFITRPDFAHYFKCNFSITPLRQQHCSESKSNNTAATDTDHKVQHDNQRNRKKKNASKSKLMMKADEQHSAESDVASSQAVTADTKWDTVKSILGQSIGDPIVRSADPCVNPFGATFVHVYKGILFEVTENGFIASVTLFRV